MFIVFLLSSFCYQVTVIYVSLPIIHILGVMSLNYLSLSLSRVYLNLCVYVCVCLSVFQVIDSVCVCVCVCLC